MQFLIGINESYRQIRGQILLIDPLPSINKVYSFLIQDDSQRSIGHSTGAYDESTTLATKASSGLGISGYGSNFGHGGKGNKNKGKERPIYSHCGIVDHVVEKCYKLHGYPPSYKAKGKNPMANQVGNFEFGVNLGVIELDSMPHQAFPFTADQYQKILAMIGSSNHGFQGQGNTIALEVAPVVMANIVSASTPWALILCKNLQHMCVCVCVCVYTFQNNQH